MLSSPLKKKLFPTNSLHVVKSNEKNEKKVPQTPIHYPRVPNHTKKTSRITNSDLILYVFDLFHAMTVEFMNTVNAVRWNKAE